MIIAPSSKMSPKLFTVAQLEAVRTWLHVLSNNSRTFGRSTHNTCFSDLTAMCRSTGYVALINKKMEVFSADPISGEITLDIKYFRGLAVRASAPVHEVILTVLTDQIRRTFGIGTHLFKTTLSKGDTKQAKDFYKLLKSVTDLSDKPVLGKNGLMVDVSNLECRVIDAGGVVLLTAREGVVLPGPPTRSEASFSEDLIKAINDLRPAILEMRHHNSYYHRTFVEAFTKVFKKYHYLQSYATTRTIELPNNDVLEFIPNGFVYHFPTPLGTSKISWTHGSKTICMDSVIQQWLSDTNFNQGRLETDLDNAMYSVIMHLGARAMEAVSAEELESINLSPLRLGAYFNDWLKYNHSTGGLAFKPWLFATNRK